MKEPVKVGAWPEGEGVRFRLWAPEHERLEVVLFDGEQAGDAYPMEREAGGYFTAFLPGLGAGVRYKYRVDGEGPFPDPASRFQPQGVHGPSEVVDPSFEWSDRDWRGLPIEAYVIYELHVGTMTPEGTFEAIIPRLDYIRELGATAIEIMPVADFPGRRNWGYDGVSLWAPSRAYGGPHALRRLVDAAHARGLAVILDVVYNHLGPDGNYLGVYSKKYFTSRHMTPWGDALNFDDEDSRPVRDFFVGNALYWLEEFHVDGLRLDATHEILDDSEMHFLRELAERVRGLADTGREIVLIAEDDRNEARLVSPIEQGGVGLDGVWADDFHHQIRRAIAGDSEGYYANYTGSTADIARTLKRGWFYEGQPQPTTRTLRGSSIDGLPYSAFVHCIQNHDQIGNRALGDRLNHDVEAAAYRAASCLLLLDPATPLLFMGQEWAASTPFLFFTDHDEELGRLVTEGRRAEFSHFSIFADESAREKIPDPQAEETFLRSKLQWEEIERAPHAGILRLYRDVLALRRRHPALVERSRDSVDAMALGPTALVMRHEGAGGRALLLIVNLRGGFAFNLEQMPLATGRPWRQLLSSEAPEYGGTGDARLEARRVELPGPGALVLEV